MVNFNKIEEGHDNSCIITRITTRTDRQVARETEVLNIFQLSWKSYKCLKKVEHV